MKKILEMFSKADDKTGHQTKAVIPKWQFWKKSSVPDAITTPLAKKKEYLTRCNSVDILCDKDHFRLLESSIFSFVAVIGVLAVVILLLATSRPTMTFFETNDKGQVQQVQPVGTDNNIISNGSVQQFVLNAIPNALTFDFNNYNYVFDTKFPMYFSSSASKEMRGFFEKNYITDLVKQKQFFNISVLSSFIIDLGDKYSKATNEWRIQVPAIINIYNGTDNLHTKIKFQMLVSYTGTRENPYGMKITNIKMLNSWDN